MTLWLRFLDSDNVLLFDLPLASANFEVGLNQSLRWSATLALDTPQIQAIFEGLSVEGYLDGNRLFSGILSDFTPELIGAETLTIQGRGFLDELYDQPAWPLSYYDNHPMLGVLTELLLSTDWRVGDVSTLADTDLVITKDLRGEKNLHTQISSFLSSIPLTYYREGEMRLGKRTLDLGQFEQSSGLLAVQPDGSTRFDDSDLRVQQITQLSYQVDFANAVYAVRAEGGRVRDTGVDRVVNLGDAVNFDTNLRFDPNFPIIEDLNEKSFAVLNVRDYADPGGEVIATGIKDANFFFGDVIGGAVENTRWVTITFMPYPGRLRYILPWFGTKDAALDTELALGNFEIRWRLHEATIGATIVLDSPALDGATLSANGGTIPAPANQPLRIFPTQNIDLVPGKIYAWCIGLSANPTADVCRGSLRNWNRTNLSNTFKLGFRDTFFDTSDGAVFTLFAQTPIISVITDPLTRIFAGFTFEKFQKDTPQKTGANVPVAEINRAGKTLYDDTVRHLNEHRPQKRQYQMTTLCSGLLPKVGDTIYVRGQALVEYFDSLTGSVLSSTYDSIDTDLKIMSYSVDFSGDKMQVSYQLQDTVVD